MDKSEHSGKTWTVWWIRCSNSELLETFFYIKFSAFFFLFLNWTELHLLHSNIYHSSISNFFPRIFCSCFSVNSNYGGPDRKNHFHHDEFFFRAITDLTVSNIRWESLLSFYICILNECDPNSSIYGTVLVSTSILDCSLSISSH